MHEVCKNAGNALLIAKEKRLGRIFKQNGEVIALHKDIKKELMDVQISAVSRLLREDIVAVPSFYRLIDELNYNIYCSLVYGSSLKSLEISLPMEKDVERTASQTLVDYLTRSKDETHPRAQVEINGNRFTQTNLVGMWVGEQIVYDPDQVPEMKLLGEGFVLPVIRNLGSNLRLDRST